MINRHESFYANYSFVRYTDRIYQCIVYALSLIIIGSIAVYHFTPATDSDMVEGLIWAEEAIQSRKLLNPDFVYPYAIPFGANLIFIPFVFLFGTTQLANSLGMIFFYIIFLITCVYFFKSLNCDYLWVTVGIAIVVLAFRSDMGVNLLHHILFYQLGFVCLLGLLGASLNLFNKSERENSHKTIDIFFLLFYSIWGGANGIPSILLACFPIIISAFILYGTSLIKSEANKSYLIISGFLFLGTLIGYGIFAYSIREIVEYGYIEKVGSYTFLPLNEWVENLYLLPQIWIDMFLVFDPAGISIISLKGAEILASIILAFLFGISPFFYFMRLKRLDKIELFVFSACVSVWGICILQYAFLRHGPEPRLLYNGICVNSILLAVFVNRRVLLLNNKRIYVLFILFLFACFTALFPARAEWKINTEPIEKLEELGLDYGVGTFWNANINTVNSGGEIKVRPVLIDNGSISPWLYQSKSSWYQRQSTDNEWFVLLSDSEYNSIKAASNQNLLSIYEKDVEIPGYHILIFRGDSWNTCIHNEKHILS